MTPPLAETGYDSHAVVMTCAEHWKDINCRLALEPNTLTEETPRKAIG